MAAKTPLDSLVLREVLCGDPRSVRVLRFYLILSILLKLSCKGTLISRCDLACDHTGVKQTLLAHFMKATKEE